MPFQSPLTHASPLAPAPCAGVTDARMPIPAHTLGLGAFATQRCRLIACWCVKQCQPHTCNCAPSIQGTPGDVLPQLHSAAFEYISRSPCGGAPPVPCTACAPRWHHAAGGRSRRRAPRRQRCVSWPLLAASPPAAAQPSTPRLAEPADAWTVHFDMNVHGGHMPLLDARPECVVTPFNL